MKMQEVEQPEDGSEGLPAPVKALFVIAAAMLIGFVIFVMLSFEGKSDEEAKLERLEAEKLPTNGDDHRELRFAYDEAPITNLKLEPLPKELDESFQVIGVEVNGKAVAFALTEKAKDLMFVNAVIGGRQVYVVHNYLGTQTRVFASEDETPIPLLLGGQDVVRDVVLLYKDIRYTQNSSRIPLEDYPFEVTGIEQWAEQHPDTLVCLRDLTWEVWDDGKFF